MLFGVNKEDASFLLLSSGIAYWFLIDAGKKILKKVYERRNRTTINIVYSC